jgi:ribosomal protein S18 acetylase RimI-like enzyme
MASFTISARAEQHTNLRPLSVLRDLPAVADLIEMCFSSTMDNDGKRYLQDMRRAGSDNSFLKWANRAAESTSLPLTGYIWEENGKIVGNASLVPFRHNSQRIYLIANVAVHPDHRRRGIARALTERALQHAREKKVNNIWLHVRDDNPGAIHLYQKLGFIERARRTSWRADPANRYHRHRQKSTRLADST